MADYDISQAFEAIENELIDSMMRNFSRHRAEETKEGYNWSQWQAEQLKSLEEYRKKNSKKFNRQFTEINGKIEEMLRKARADGNAQQEAEILQAIKDGFKVPSKLSETSTAEFFKVNDRKLDALIKATTDDFKRAETAILRMSNDKYRKAIFNAQVYANTGAGTYEQAVDMACRDMLRAGLNCIEYKNGARHTLPDYARMAIRTANKRAYLRGEGEKRQEWGITTVVVNSRQGGCPKCAEYIGRVFIDDVYSGGKKSDGDYPLLSTAIQGGLFHPNCKDGTSTYYEGITTLKPVTEKEKEQMKQLDKAEQKKTNTENQAEKYSRIANYSLDEDNKRIYSKRAQAWENKAKQTSEKLNTTVEKSAESGIIKLYKSVKIPDDCTYLLNADTNFADKDISVDILRSINSTIENNLSKSYDFRFDEIKLATFSKNDRSIFITNLESRGFINKTQLYLNKDVFYGVSKESIDKMCLDYYKDNWWKSKSLEDLVNHEIMHAKINYYNSFEKVERLYQTLREDNRVKSFCGLVDKYPDEFMNEMYVALNNGEKINKRYLDVYNEYIKEFLGE